MSIAQKFSRVVRRELLCHAAWEPLVNTYAVGDYGVFRGGVFEKFGSIADYGVQFGSQPSGNASWNFSSQGVTTVALEANAEIPLAQIGSAVDARLKIAFASKHSFFVRAGDIYIDEMTALPDVASQLRALPAWNRRWRVVRVAKTARKASVVGSAASSAEIVLGGSGSALKSLLDASLSGEISVESQRDVGFEYVGKTGVVGLEFFRLNSFGDGIHLEGVADLAGGSLVELDGPVTEDDEPADDL